MAFSNCNRIHSQMGLLENTLQFKLPHGFCIQFKHYVLVRKVAECEVSDEK